MLVVSEDDLDQILLVLPYLSHLVVYILRGQVFLTCSSVLFFMLGRMSSRLALRKGIS